MATTTRYYLIRIWEEEAIEVEKPAVWRALMEDPRSGQRWGFDNPAALLAFLETLIGNLPAHRDELLNERQRGNDVIKI